MPHISCFFQVIVLRSDAARVSGPLLVVPSKSGVHTKHMHAEISADLYSVFSIFGIDTHNDTDTPAN